MVGVSVLQHHVDSQSSPEISLQHLTSCVAFFFFFDSFQRDCLKSQKNTDTIELCVSGELGQHS